jgi:hypothetical protein
MDRIYRIKSKIVADWYGSPVSHENLCNREARKEREENLKQKGFTPEKILVRPLRP